jgi:hypothetical protein
MSILGNNTNPEVEVVAIKNVRWETSPGVMTEIKQGQTIRIKQSELNYQRTQSKFLPPTDAAAYFKERNIKPAYGGKH